MKYIKNALVSAFLAIVLPSNAAVSSEYYKNNRGDLRYLNQCISLKHSILPKKRFHSDTAESRQILGIINALKPTSLQDHLSYNKKVQLPTDFKPSKQEIELTRFLISFLYLHLVDQRYFFDNSVSDIETDGMAVIEAQKLKCKNTAIRQFNKLAFGFREEKLFQEKKKTLGIEESNLQPPFESKYLTYPMFLFLKDFESADELIRKYSKEIARFAPWALGRWKEGLEPVKATSLDIEKMFEESLESNFCNKTPYSVGLKINLFNIALWKEFGDDFKVGKSDKILRFWTAFLNFHNHDFIQNLIAHRKNFVFGTGSKINGFRNKKTFSKWKPIIAENMKKVEKGEQQETSIYPLFRITDDCGNSPLTYGLDPISCLEQKNSRKPINELKQYNKPDHLGACRDRHPAYGGMQCVAQAQKLKQQAFRDCDKIGLKIRTLTYPSTNTDQLKCEKRPAPEWVRCEYKSWRNPSYQKIQNQRKLEACIQDLCGISGKLKLEDDQKKHFYAYREFSADLREMLKAALSDLDLYYTDNDREIDHKYPSPYHSFKGAVDIRVPSYSGGSFNDNVQFLKKIASYLNENATVLGEFQLPKNNPFRKIKVPKWSPKKLRLNAKQAKRVLEGRLPKEKSKVDKVLPFNDGVKTPLKPITKEEQVYNKKAKELVSGSEIPLRPSFKRVTLKYVNNKLVSATLDNKDNASHIHAHVNVENQEVKEIRDEFTLQFEQGKQPEEIQFQLSN